MPGRTAYVRAGDSRENGFPAAPYRRISNCRHQNNLACRRGDRGFLQPLSGRLPETLQMLENRTLSGPGSYRALSKFDFEAGSIDCRNSPVRFISTNSSKTFLPI